MPEFEAGFYDFDGTLANSQQHNKRLMILGLRALGEERSEDVIRAAMAFPWDDCVRYMFPHADQSLIELYDHYVTDAHYQTIDDLEIFPGVLDTLRSNHQQQISLAIVSNREHSIYWMLRKKGLYDYFDAFVDVSMVKEPKPSPEPTRLAASFLSVNPKHCFAVGDSITDIKSYQKAGVGLTIGFAPGYDGDGLWEANPDHIVQSYKTIEYIISHGIRRVGDEPVVWREV